MSQTLRIPVPTVKITAAMEVHDSLDLAWGEPDIQETMLRSQHAEKGDVISSQEVITGKKNRLQS